MSKAKDRGAVLQFEFDRKRVRAMKRVTSRVSDESVNVHVHDVIRGAVQDVIDNGGTLVLVVTEHKITIVQRPDAEDLDTPEQTK